jgi:hypothetical protein
MLALMEIRCMRDAEIDTSAELWREWQELTRSFTEAGNRAWEEPDGVIST